MCDAKLVLEIIIFSFIFIISVTVPIYLFIRVKIKVPFFCSLMSLGFTLLLMVIYLETPLPKGRTGEFYEVFWLLPAIFVGTLTFVLSQIKKRKRGKNREVGL